MHAFKLAVEKRSVLCKTVISYGVITNFVLSTFNREKTRRKKCLVSYPGSEGFVRVWTNRETEFIVHSKNNFTLPAKMETKDNYLVMSKEHFSY